MLIRLPSLLPWYRNPILGQAYLVPRPGKAESCSGKCVVELSALT